MEKPVEHETEEKHAEGPKKVVPHDILRCYMIFPVELDAEDWTSEQTRVGRHFHLRKSVLHDIHKHRLRNSINTRDL